MAIRVIVVDDHPVVREGLKRVLEQDRNLEVCGEAGSGEEALQVAGLQHPDVALLDMRLPGLGGIDLLERFRQEFPTTKLICLTFYGEQYLAQALAAGASGYLTKEASREEVVLAVRAVLQGRTFIHPSFSSKVYNQFAHLVREGPKTFLTHRQLEVVKQIALGGTNKEISRHLYLSETTVKREIRIIFDKLDARDRAQAVSRAHEKGLL